jgi:hypothetical protein
MHTTSAISPPLNMYYLKIELAMVSCSTFKISHVVSDLSERTSSYACAMSGSLRISDGAGIFGFGRIEESGGQGLRGKR